MNLDKAVKTYLSLKAEAERINQEVENKIGPLKELIAQQERDADVLLSKVDKKMKVIEDKIKEAVKDEPKSVIPVSSGIIKKRASSAVVFKKDIKVILSELRKRDMKLCIVSGEDTINKNVVKHLDPELQKELGIDVDKKINVNIEAGG